MYVAIVGGGRGSAKKYVLVKESFRDEQGRPRSRTVQNLGPLDALLEKDPQALEKLRARFQSDREAKRTTAAAVRAERLRAQLDSVEDSHLPMPVVRYGHFPLRRIWTKDLQLDVKIRNLQAKSARVFDLNAALFFLTFTKILDPTSARFDFASKDEFIGDPAADLTLEDFGSALDLLAGAKDEIFGWVNRRLDAQFGKTRTTLVVCDVSTDFASEPLSVALVVDAAGFPRDFAVRAGDGSASSTNAFETLKRKYGVEGSIETTEAISEAFRTMAGSFVLHPMDVQKSARIEGHFGICVLALLLVQLLQEKLRKADVLMSAEEIGRTLSSASTALLRSGDALAFLHVGEVSNPRRGSPEASTEALLASTEAEKAKPAGIEAILRATGLKPLPRTAGRHELARCLGTRFGSDAEALSPIVLAQL